MIELIAIILQFFIFFIISSFPFNPTNLNKLLKPYGNSYNYIDCHAINIIVLINILLVASFFEIQLTKLFLLIFLISISFLIIRNKEYLSLINKKNYIKFFFFFAIVISIFILISFSAKLIWDGFHWITKALVFFNNENIQNLKYTDMPQYPHLGGYIWAFFWKNSLLEYEYFGRLFYAYIYVVSIFLIFNVIKKQSEKIILLQIFALILITYDQYLFSGYQEYLIFSTLIIASRFIITINFKKNIEHIKVLLVLFILLPLMWFKEEGMFYFLIFGLLLVVMQNCNIKNKILYFIGMLFAVYIQYNIQKLVIGYYGFPVEFISQTFIDQITNFKLIFIKFVAITKHMLIAAIKYPLWIMVIFSLLFLLFKRSYKVENYHFRFFFNAFILNVLFVYAVYLHDPNEYEFILSVTLDRVIFQTSGFYLINIIFLLNMYKFKK